MVIINSIIIFIAITFTVVTFLPGVFSIKNQKNIFKKYADGYNLYEWANKNLPNNSVVLTSHRSYSFSKNSFISYDFRLYVRTQEELNYYIESIIKKKPTHLLYSGIEHGNIQDVLKYCRGKLLIRGKNAYQRTPRNPFNNTQMQHDGYIYEVDLDKLKKCKKI